MFKKKTVAIMSLFVLLPGLVNAANIDSSNRYAWGENIGWIDFATEAGNVEVSDTQITGYAYSENVGWISLNCANTDDCDSIEYGVTNDGTGNLSGYAWSENIGWIDFSGVTIEQGDFFGYAYSPNIGYVSFNCINTETCDDIDFKVSTTWEVFVDNSTTTDNTSNNPSSGGRRRSGSTRTVSSTASAPTGSLSSEIVITNPTTGQPEDSWFEQNRLSSIEMDLEYGMTHINVKRLQQLLNSLGYTLAESGPGSPGNETEYFGVLTRTALAKYQADHAIYPSAGYFGPITRAYLALQGF